MSRQVGALLLAPVLGLFAMITPVLLNRPHHWYEAPLFPVIRNAVEHVGLPALGLLVLAGLALGAVSQLQPWKLGAATMALFPVAAIAEIVVDSTSHNLWPFEFVIYAFYGCLVAGGVALTQHLRNRTAGTHGA